MHGPRGYFFIVIPGRAEGAGPESIFQSRGVMDCGFAAIAAPRNDSYAATVAGLGLAAGS
jgi:hypothetical protein